MKPFFYSCVVDSSPIFYYQTWNLVNSLLNKGEAISSEIFVNYTEDVDDFFIKQIKKMGVNLIPIKRFGDGKYCNKIAQLDNELFKNAECVFFLDTDMIVLGNITSIYSPDTIAGKIVDRANPGIELLKKIFNLAGFQEYPNICEVDFKEKGSLTFQNNLNGGLYAIPSNLIPQIKEKWKKWALWLLENVEVLELLKKHGKQRNIDQISFAMASFELSIPIKNIDKIYNYPAHLDFKKIDYPLVMHYHRQVSKMGLIVPRGQCSQEFLRSIKDANHIISKNFNNRIFWSFFYHQFLAEVSGKKKMKFEFHTTQTWYRKMRNLVKNSNP